MVVERIRALQRHAITVIPNETALLLADLTGASTDIVLETRRNTPRQILPDSFSQALSNDKDGLVRIQAALLKVSVAIVAANAAYQSRLHDYLPELPETTEVMRKLWMASSGRPGQQMILGGIENVLNNVTFDGFLWVVLALMLLSTLLRRM